MELPNVVTRLTVILAAVFLTIIIGTALAVRKNKTDRVLDETNARHIGEMQVG